MTIKEFVIPAQAGIQCVNKRRYCAERYDLDSSLRWNDNVVDKHA